MHFQIYIPKRCDAWPTLDDVGLGHLAHGAHSAELLNSAPGPAPGRLFSWPTVAAPQCGFLPGSEWLPAAAAGELPAGRYLVGIRSDSPPTPGDLARAKQFGGAHVTLGDGQAWLIPAAAQLPSRMELRQDGSVQLLVRDRFREFWSRSECWFRWFMGMRDGLTLDDNDLWRYVCDALTLNYRITPEVVSWLSLVGTDTYREIVSATVDGHTIRHVEEKKTAEIPAI